MDKALLGKRVLFFGLETMGYEKKILEKMRELGAIVDYHSERPVSSKIGKAILKVSPNALNLQTEEYYRRIIDSHKDSKYDVIFIMKCDVPTSGILQCLRRVFPDSELRLHLWDSLANIPGINEKLRLFDRITSFDRVDCQNHSDFGFRPLFYLDELTTASDVSKIYDICFLGTIHSDRYVILEIIRKQCERMGLNFYGYYYMQSRLAYAYLKLTDKRFKSVDYRSLEFKTLNFSDVKRIIDSSDTIVDIQHPSQTGLTMRTIEALGAGKKLITTNEDILNYDFYNPSNVYILDRTNPVIPEVFLRGEFRRVDEYIYRRYSLGQWVVDVLTM